MPALTPSRIWNLSLPGLLAACAAAQAPLAQFPPPRASDPQPSFESIRFGDGAVQATGEDFFPDESGTNPYDPHLPSPESLLGRPVGARMAQHAEIVAALRTWDALSPRLVVDTYGRTYEGRELTYALISSGENLARLHEIQRDIHRLWDPRGLAPAEAEEICKESPAIAWMGYSIHGDETSGADAALALAFHLIASSSAEIGDLLRQVVIVLDPVMNPDGRERYLGMVAQNTGYVSNLDYASMQRGRWPFGRGNHYLFDMNRDWMGGVAPETRGRWRLALAFHPQLFVDGHEMGALDTFLFYPQADPHLPSLPEKLAYWQARFAEGASQAFDQRGWAYYTREWADAWAPFYSDSWGSLNGAIGMLYEQAGLGGAALRRASGQVMTYRQAVQGQAVASLANLQTLAANRAQILRDFLENRRFNCDSERPGGKAAFVLVPGANATRQARLLATLLDQGVWIEQAQESFSGSSARSALGELEQRRSFPAGSYLIPRAQPQGALVEAYLGLDPRLPQAFLEEERHELERQASSKIYDVTAWDLGSSFALDVWWCEPESSATKVLTRADLEQVLHGPGRVQGESGSRTWGWVVDGADDRSQVFLARALELGVRVHLAQTSFETADLPGRTFARGSLLIRRNENGAEVAKLVEKASQQSRSEVFAITSGRAGGAGPDLGGQEFDLLARPRIALVANAPIEREAFGHLWHFLDVELGVPVTLLDAQSFGSYDLRRYNVLILPSANGIGEWLTQHSASLRAWTMGGGTLIACASSAAALARDKSGLSAVRERSEVLPDLASWLGAMEREASRACARPSPAEIWDGPELAAANPEKGAAESMPAEKEPAAPDAAQEEWLARFSPQGSFLLARAAEESWLTFGNPAVLPVFFSGDHVLLAREPVQTLVRLGNAKELRLGGLLWPEARQRLALSAWLTRESLGHGQIILFASAPTFRGTQQGSARYFANAVLYGPGVGAEPPLEW